MKLTDKNITLFALTCFIIISTTWLFLNPIQPKEKPIAEIKEGDFVIIKAHIQDMKVKRDKLRHVEDISRIVINDGTGNLDVVAFGDTRKKLLNYILSYNPMIKTGDYVEVKGRISVYKGKYEIILEDIEDYLASLFSEIEASSLHRKTASIKHFYLFFLKSYIDKNVLKF